MTAATTTEAPNLFECYSDLLTTQEQEDLTALVLSIAGEDSEADVRIFDPATHVSPNPLSPKPVAVVQPPTEVRGWIPSGAIKVRVPYFTYGSRFDLRPVSTGLHATLRERGKSEYHQEAYHGSVLPLREQGTMSLLDFDTATNPDLHNGHGLPSGLYVESKVLELTVISSAPKGEQIADLEEAVRDLTRLPAAPRPGEVPAPVGEIRGFEQGWAVEKVADEGATVADGMESRRATVALRRLDPDRELPRSIPGKHATGYGLANVSRTGERSLSITWTRRAEG